MDCEEVWKCGPDKVERIKAAKKDERVVAGYGIFAFHKRQIGEYLLMKMHFVFYDYTENVMFFMLDYLAVMILIAVAGYYISMLLKKIK